MQFWKKLTLFDLIILLAFIFLIFDTYDSYKNYKNCEKPINLWMLGMYIFTFLLRFNVKYAVIATNVGQRRLSFCLWFTIFILFFPFAIYWSVLGSIWDTEN